MLTTYIQVAMRKAHCELLEDATYYGEIPGFEGVWGNADTLEACREELQDVLEDWLLFSFSRGFSVPVVDGIDLAITQAPA